jgi:hypothetical protein
MPDTPKRTKKKTSSKKRATKKATATKSSSRKPTKEAYNFPKNSLEDSVALAKAIEEKFAGKPTPASELVTPTGFNKVTDWRFLDLLRSAEFFGLTKGTGQSASVELQKIGSDVVAPTNQTERRKAMWSAFNNVAIFKAVYDHYKGKKLPEDEYFENTLVREFDIPKERVELFIDSYKKSLQYVESFAGDGKSVSDVSAKRESPSGDRSDAIHDLATSDKRRRTREFIDNCFVIMPFGDWFDRYYREIYCEAIEDAGFEPCRADELFSTGSVIEQIWNEIKKADVILAELTGKNANVFYELGLAHALRKPVVFLSSDINDVPFDLRHLRVILYDVREPDWAATLRRDIAEYLKNAKNDPAKSIPSPFRNDEDYAGQQVTSAD